MIKAIIVDDEAKARRILQAMLEANCPDVEVIDTADDVPSAVIAINKHKPQLVFLDIEMPGYSGFQLMDFFDEMAFEVIFTTAYSEYALKAFEVSAIDYLLKPIQIEQLEKAIDKFRKRKDSSTTRERLEVLSENMVPGSHVAKLALPVAEGLRFVRPEEVVYLQADSSYTKIFLNNGDSVIISKTLKEFERLLDHPCFMRVHRSFIVNLNHVTQFIRADGGHLVMDNKDKVFFSKEKRDDILAAFKANQ